MAKALFGHVGAGTDLRLVDEVRRLRARVTDLEDELARQVLSGQVSDGDTVAFEAPNGELRVKVLAVEAG